KAGDDHIGLKVSDYPHYIAQHFLFVPKVERLLGSLAVTEVEAAGEELLRAIYPSRCQQLLCADEAELDALLIADEVLATVAAGDGEIAGAYHPVFRQPGEQTGVFV